jgi:uncharacterized protein YdbL (DUF1318 family)
MEPHQSTAGDAAGSFTDHLRARTRPGQLLPGIDGRSAWVRRCRDLITAHIADLGGVDNCSAAERSIVRRASVLTVELERFEARFATAGEASVEDLDAYQRVANSLRRLLEAVGLQRRAKTVETLSEYLTKLREAEVAKEATEINGNGHSDG